MAAACSATIRQAPLGDKSNWSKRNASVRTASSPRGASTESGKSFRFSVTMTSARPRRAAATTWVSSGSGRSMPDASGSQPSTSASSNASFIDRKRLRNRLGSTSGWMRTRALSASSSTFCDQIGRNAPASAMRSSVSHGARGTITHASRKAVNRATITTAFAPAPEPLCRRSRQRRTVRLHPPAW